MIFICRAAIKYIRELTTENERLRAENIRQAKELTDRQNHDPELSSSGEVAVAGDDTADGTVPEAEVPGDSLGK